MNNKEITELAALLTLASFEVAQHSGSSGLETLMDEMSGGRIDPLAGMQEFAKMARLA